MILATPPPVSAPSADHAAEWDQPPDARLLAAFYPALAMRAHIGGRVRMRCIIKATGALSACSILEEDPPGYGFGEATLNAAAAFRMKPAVRGGRVVDDGVVFIPLNWVVPPSVTTAREAATSVDPTPKIDLGDKAAPAIVLSKGPETHVSIAERLEKPFVQHADWAQLPTGDDMAEFYPEAAQRAAVGGRVTMNCTVRTSGLLSECAIMSEEPTGFGFGLATLKLSARFRMKPATELSGPSNDGQVTIPVRWAMPEPTDLDSAMEAMGAQGGGIFFRALPWDQKPTEAQIAAAYPAKARSRGVAGDVQLICHVATDGALQDCEANAQPDGLGFGEAALKLAASYRAATITPDGDRTAGAVAILPIAFRLQTPVPPSRQSSSP